MNSYSFKDKYMVKLEQRIQVSRHGDRRDSALLGRRNRKLREDNESSRGNRACTRTQEENRDKDQMSDSEQSDASYSYSDRFESNSLSDRPFSPHHPPTPRKGPRTQRVSKISVHPTGVRKVVPRRPGPLTLPPLSCASTVHSQKLSKDAPPQNLSLVTKTQLSARLLKITQLKNTLAEQQAHIDELQRENRLLKQFQLRQEKSLQRYGNTESEISELITRHDNEIHVLRERLQRSLKKERMAERRCTEAEAQLEQCQDQLHKLQQLADEKRLGEKGELARKLAHAQVKVQESERKVKELEKNIELSRGIFQRQLASERKKTLDAQQESRTLRNQITKLSAKLKERERELDARGIYELENSTGRKGGSRSSSKAVQTEEVSLKEQESSEQRETGAGAQRIQETIRAQEEVIACGIEKELIEKDGVTERERKMESGKERVQKQGVNLEFDLSKKKGTRQGDGRDRDEEDRKRRSDWQTEEEKVKEPHLSEQEIQASQERAEEQRRRKDQLLAKLREVDMEGQAQYSRFFHDETERAQNPPQEHNTSVFSFIEPHEHLSTPETGKQGTALRSLKTNQDLDLTFGSYTPSFGDRTPRRGLRCRSPRQTVEQLSEDENEVMDLTEHTKEKKSDLLQQLFGSSFLSASNESHKMELLSSPGTKSTSGRGRGTLNISDSGPAFTAITTLDSDIDEITL
ncbi:lebercilin-like [Hemibagrus wyckioides]|uniref:lebercilin-like n=1 Tax=Hemibagrus wyckioides TaxID=337641 RepID=UPI00266D04C6|nr:lebercilin-like [Hemibagrus wyckioides]